MCLGIHNSLLQLMKMTTRRAKPILFQKWVTMELVYVVFRFFVLLSEQWSEKKFSYWTGHILEMYEFIFSLPFVVHIQVVIINGFKITLTVDSYDLSRKEDAFNVNIKNQILKYGA